LYLNISFLIVSNVELSLHNDRLQPTVNFTE
jgi:hypothetical protein